jgi:arylsulfatase A-like enzyme
VPLSGDDFVALQEVVVPDEKEAQQKRPHVIMIMSDDQGFGQVGYNGRVDIHTPNLDTMAAESVVLDRFYAAAPICSPTRVSILTGLHPYRQGCYTVQGCTLDHDAVTLSETLQGEGYTTAHFGKWHIGNPSGANKSWPDQHGFDYSFSSQRPFEMGTETFYENGVKQTVNITEDTSVYIVDKGVDYLEAHLKVSDEPLFMMLWLSGPHAPYAAEEQDKAWYAGLTEDQQNQYGEVTGADRSVGILREALRDLAVEEDTVLWFNSDNGAGARQVTIENGELRGGKDQMYEGGIRVPALIEYPAALSAHTNISNISTLDMMPTILDFAGLTVPAGLDGVSHMSSLLTQAQSESDIALWYEREITSLDSIDDSTGVYLSYPYKLIKNSGTDFELYNVATDAGEENDVSSSQSNIVNDLTAKLENWQRSVLQDSN